MPENIEHTKVIDDMETESHKTQNYTSVGHETNTDEGVLASLGINLQLFVFQLINFAIVALVVWFLILKPLTKKMEERKKIIDESLDNAKRVESNLQMSEQKFQEKIDEAKAQANKVIELAGEEAEKLKIDMREKAKSEIEILITQAKRNIQIEKEEMVEEIKQETIALVVDAVEKIILEKLDPKKDKKLIEDSIEKLKS